jgi:hypothetical protein
MTEDQIERRVERIMDTLDARLMSGSLSQSDYDQEVKRLRAWAERQYQKSPPAPIGDEPKRAAL